MALVLKDRVKETTTTTGTGTYTLAGAVAGFEAFSEIGNSNTTYYCCTDGTDFEVGIGTYTASGTTLARTTILQSSNSDAAVNWTSGTRTIFCTQPAEKAVFLDGDGKLGIGTDDPQQLLHVAYSSSATDLTANAGADLSTGMRVNNTNTGTNSFASIDLRANNADVRLASVYKGANQSDFVVLVDKAGGFPLEEALRVSSEGDVTITSSDSDAGEAPTLKLLRNSSSPADSDEIGEIEFVGKNDAAEDTTYFRVFTSIADVSDGTEDARLEFKGLNAGSEVTYLQLKFGQIVAVRDLAMGTGRNILFEGATSNNNETTLTVADPSADRTITLPDATGTVALTSNLGTIASQAADSVNIDGGAVDGITLGTNSAVTELQVDNINIDGNTISITNTNGNIGITPNGTGDVHLNADNIRIGDLNADASITTRGTGDLTLNTNSGTNSGSIVIADGANGNISITPDGTGTVDIISTDAGSGIGPSLHLYRNSASPADFDDLGALYFTGNDDAGNRQEYAFIRGDTADVSSGSEDAIIRFSANVGGSSLEHMNLSFGATQITGRLYLASNSIHSNPHIQFEGSTGNSHETTFNVTDPTADRTITLPDATGTVQLTDGSGASLTSLNASELGSGTVPNARLDAQLQDVAGLAVTNGNFIVGDGSNFVAESGSTARTSLGLGTAAVLDTGISNTNVPKFTSGVSDNDFLRVDGTAIEGRSASEVLSDIAAMPLAGGTFTGDVTLKDTATGSGAGPLLTLRRDSSSPADDDNLARIKFQGENDADEIFDYATITGKLLDNTDGTEDGGIVFAVGANGSALSNRISLQGFGDTIFSNKDVRLNTDVDLKFEGATANDHETTLTVTDPTADRTITLPDATGTVQLIDGSGASLTSLNASQLSSGTVPNARLDAQLQDVAGLAVTNGNFIVGDGSNFVAESGSTARASLGLGTAAVAATGISNGNVPVFTSGVADNDFLRVNGTSIEGRSATELASDIGAATTDDATALAIALG